MSQREIRCRMCRLPRRVRRQRCGERGSPVRLRFLFVIVLRNHFVFAMASVVATAIAPLDWAVVPSEASLKEAA